MANQHTGRDTYNFALFLTCTICQQENPATDFSFRRDNRAYRKECKKCRVLQTTRNVAQNKERVQAYQRAYRQNNHKELAAYHLEYKRNNRDRMRIYRQRRRAAKAGLRERLSLEQIGAIYERFGHACFNCGSQDDLAVDHHNPLSAGYPLREDNAVILCRPCNSTKSARSPLVFYGRGRLAELVYRFGITPHIDQDNYRRSLPVSGLRMTAKEYHERFPVLSVAAHYTPDFVIGDIGIYRVEEVA